MSLYGWFMYTPVWLLCVVNLPDVYWLPLSMRRDIPRAMPGSAFPNSRASAMETGSRAAKRFPFLHTCHPMHSAFQCSTHPNAHPQPSSRVNTLAPSDAHMTLGSSVINSPSCSRGGEAGTRWGDRRLFSLMMRRTRLRATLMPLP